MINVVILGATGSIGQNTLHVIAQHPDKFRAFALSANNNVDKMLMLCAKHQPRYVVFHDVTAAQQFQNQIKNTQISVEILVGVEALKQIVALPEVDCVMAAITGAAGLAPTLAAVEAGKRVLLANKETLVMMGELMLAAAKHAKAQLIPIDSEHNAIFQCLPPTFKIGEALSTVQRITLTASGGPFRLTPLSELQYVTPDQACAHPNWSMGRKISVDSATMLNKGLELIEAHWLFGQSLDSIDVVLHPQSIIHSLVEYVDGSVLAQLANPDMCIPIAYALAWPKRIAITTKRLDLTQIATLNFEPVCLKRFPCLHLAREAIRAGGTAPTILNAANEIAVQAFLSNQINFPKIAQIIDAALQHMGGRKADSLAIILEDDAIARKFALQSITNNVLVAQD